MAMAAALNAVNTGHSSPALAYANAQLSQYAQNQSTSQLPRSSSGNFFHQAQQPGNGNNVSINQQLAALFSHQSHLPSHLNPHSLSTNLSEYNSQSMPNSAASSPGAQYRRLPGTASGYPSGTMTGTNTPGGGSRIAASAITGKRLNWSEMICQTIAESESGRLVIQDLFEGMCSKFPEIREWAFGKDWEARVKNRIKSTLSIKGNLFIKVPRPSSASGKGSWWTLSQEAQDAWKEGRVASVVKNGSHSRNASQGRHDGLTMSTATSRANSRAPSRRGSPVSSRGPSSQHAQHANQHQNQRPGQNYVNFGSDSFGHTANSISPSNQHASSSGASGSSDSRRQSPSSGLPMGLGMSPINFNANNSFDGLSLGMSGFDSIDEVNSQDPSSQRMRMMENSVNDNFDASASTSNPISTNSMSIPSMNPNASSLYDVSPYNSFSQNATSQQFGGLSSAAHMGGPQSMPFPASSSGVGDGSLTSSAPSAFAPSANDSLGNYGEDPTLGGAFAGLDLSNIEGLHNPFGSMAGGYTMLADGNASGAQPPQFPPRNGTQSGSGSGGRSTPNVNSFNASFMGGPSPADSTGSTSAFFAYTPAMHAADAAVGNTQGSALGPVGGEGSKKKRDASGSVSLGGDFHLPPSEQTNAKKEEDEEQIL